MVEKASGKEIVAVQEVEVQVEVQYSEDEEGVEEEQREAIVR